MSRFLYNGIHPASRKNLTRKKPLSSLDQPPKEVALHLDMCSGAPSIPLVKPGQRVCLGEPVAAANSDDGVFLHASVSGKITAIEHRPHPWDGETLAIIIRNDRQDTPYRSNAVVNHKEMTQEALIALLSESGISEMNGVPEAIHTKIQSARGKVDTLIVDVAECEPYLTADHRLLLERGKQVLLGTQILSRLLGVERTFIVSEGDKLNAIERIERTMRKADIKILLRTIPTRYPMGSEKNLIRTVTGREVPSGMDSTSVACSVFNVATVYSIGQMLTRKTPLTHRAITVTGGAVVRPRNLWVPVGTSISWVLQSCGGLSEEPGTVLVGGPMTGIAQQNLTAPILKNTTGIVCLAPQEISRSFKQELCLQCGHCLSVCPMRLSPAFVKRALDERNPAKLAALNVDICTECGCCAYSCPCHIPLTDVMRQSKSLLHNSKEVAP